MRKEKAPVLKAPFICQYWSYCSTQQSESISIMVYCLSFCNNFCLLHCHVNDTVQGWIWSIAYSICQNRQHKTTLLWKYKFCLWAVKENNTHAKTFTTENCSSGFVCYMWPATSNDCGHNQCYWISLCRKLIYRQCHWNSLSMARCVKRHNAHTHTHTRLAARLCKSIEASRVCCL